MKVHTQKLKKGGAKITFSLTDEELVMLSKICDGNGGFADPPRAVKKIGMRNTPCFQGVLQCGFDRRLADNLGKSSGAVFAVQRLRHEGIIP